MGIYLDLLRGRHFGRGLLICFCILVSMHVLAPCLANTDGGGAYRPVVPCYGFGFLFAG